MARRHSTFHFHFLSGLKISLTSAKQEAMPSPGVQHSENANFGVREYEENPKRKDREIDPPDAREPDREMRRAST